MARNLTLELYLILHLYLIATFHTLYFVSYIKYAIQLLIYH
jgi:hypothetical protein